MRLYSWINLRRDCREQGCYVHCLESSRADNSVSYSNKEAHYAKCYRYTWKRFLFWFFAWIKPKWCQDCMFLRDFSSSNSASYLNFHAFTVFSVYVHTVSICGYWETGIEMKNAWRNVAYTNIFSPLILCIANLTPCFLSIPTANFRIISERAAAGILWCLQLKVVTFLCNCCSESELAAVQTCNVQNGTVGTVYWEYTELNLPYTENTRNETMRILCIWLYNVCIHNPFLTICGMKLFVYWKSVKWNC